MVGMTTNVKNINKKLTMEVFTSYGTTTDTIITIITYKTVDGKTFKENGIKNINIYNAQSNTFKLNVNGTDYNSNGTYDISNATSFRLYVYGIRNQYSGYAEVKFND